jgi:hypothetical protein
MLQFRQKPYNCMRVALPRTKSFAGIIGYIFAADYSDVIVSPE